MTNQGKSHPDKAGFEEGTYREGEKVCQDERCTMRVWKGLISYSVVIGYNKFISTKKATLFWNYNILFFNYFKK